MLMTMLVAAVGVSRTLSLRLLGGWAFALVFRREVFASHDVSYTAGTTLPPSRRRRMIGALLDELLLVTGLAPSVANELAEWRWRLRCAHHTGGLARLVRFGRGERRTRAP